MVKRAEREIVLIDGYFDFVIPPLEGFWWQDGVVGVDYARKEDFRFISAIRLPGFVSVEDFDWAVSEAARKKGMDFSRVEFLSIDEGLCVQCMRIGPYDDVHSIGRVLHLGVAALTDQTSRTSRGGMARADSTRSARAPSAWRRCSTSGYTTIVLSPATQKSRSHVSGWDQRSSWPAAQSGSFRWVLVATASWPLAVW